LVGEFAVAGIDQTIIIGGEYINTSSDQNRFNSVFDSNGDDQEFIQISDDGFFNFFNGSGFNRDEVFATSQFTDLNDDTDVNIDVFSTYIQNEIHVTDWLDIVLGGRFDSFDITVDNVATFIETGENNILSRTDSKVSPRLGIVFKPRENISLYGSFSETFLPRSGEQFANINPPNDALDPNTSQNVEVGLKWNLTNQFGFTIAAFDIENSSPLPNDDDTGTLDIIDSNVRGFEAQLQGDITDRWYVSLGYSLINGNQVDIITDANGNNTLIDATNADGERLRLRELPKNTFNAWSHYQLTEKFGLGLGVTYQDESFAGNNNEVTLPSFTRVDAAAFYDVHDDLRLQVNIENLTDTEYFPNAHTNNNITVGQPINAKFTVSGRF
ncbi:TonB-dependent receptor, partial [Hellea sp.]|nr:TonB-dependent receptor [Hellea sp.]